MKDYSDATLSDYPSVKEAAMKFALGNDMYKADQFGTLLGLFYLKAGEEGIKQYLGILGDVDEHE